MRTIIPITIIVLNFLMLPHIHATLIEDPDKGDLLNIDLDIAEERTETGKTISFEMREEEEEYAGEESVVEYASPFTEPLKEDEVRFWVDEERGWIEYRIPEDTIILKSRAEMEYSDIHLRADEIEYHSNTKIIYAEGEAELADSTGLVEGDRMSYSFETKKGLVYEGESKIEKGFYEADILKKIGDEEYCAYMGDFTTCEYSHKHYYFWSPKVKIYPGDKIVAKPVVLFIHDFPIFALPYYIMDLKKERHSGFLFPHIRYIGGNNPYVIINNGYYWAINDNCDFTFLLDYNSRSGWGQKLNFVYKYGSDTVTNSVYTTHYRDRVSQSEWWKIYSTHRQDFGQRTYLLMRLDFRNDTSFDKYFNESFEMRTKKDLSSYLTLTKSTDFVSITSELSRKTSLTEEGTVTNDKIDSSSGDTEATYDILPRISFSGMKIELGSSKLYLGWSGSAENRYINGELTSRMAEIRGNLSYPFKLLRYLRVEPRINGVGQWHYVDEYGDHNRYFRTYSISTSVNTKIYGIFNPGESELRHIISPRVTHSYSPAYDTTWMLSGGGDKDESHSISFSLGHAFVYIPPKDSDSQKVNFLDINQSISYDFKKEYEKFSNLSTSIKFSPTFSPMYNISSRLSLSHDLYDRIMSSLQWTTSFSLNTSAKVDEDEEDDTEDEESSDDYYEEDPYREDTYGIRELGVGKTYKKGLIIDLYHSYSKSHGSSGSQSIKASLSYAITKNWRLSYDTFYNISTGDFSYQSFSIYRDLHCWEARVSINYARGTVEYWFEIRIKDIPEIRVQGEQSRTL